MKIRILTFILLSIFLIASISAATFTVTTFNDSSTSKSLTFSGNQNQTVYIDIPKSTVISNASFNISTTYSEIGDGRDGVLLFTTTTKSYGNLIAGTDYDVAGNTLYLKLNREYNFTNFTLGSGTVLSTNSWNGAILLLKANDTINISGLVNLSGSISQYGQYSNTYTKYGLSISAPSAASGYGSGGNGGGTAVAGSNAGGGGGASGGNTTNTGGQGGTCSISSDGVCSNAGVAGTAVSSTGGGGAASGLLTSSSNCWVTPVGGNGGTGWDSSGKGNNGQDGNPAWGHGGSWSCTYASTGGGGGGAGGRPGKSGIHFYIYSNNIYSTGIIDVSGTKGGDGGNGGQRYVQDGTTFSYGGYGGSGAGGGNSGNIRFYSSILQDASTKIMNGGSAGVGGYRANAGGYDIQASSGTAGSTGSFSNGDISLNSTFILLDTTSNILFSSIGKSFAQQNYQISQFRTTINSYLSTCSIKSNNMCGVPILIHSDTTGIIVLNGLYISGGNATNISSLYISNISNGTSNFTIVNNNITVAENSNLTFTINGSSDTNFIDIFFKWVVDGIVKATGLGVYTFNYVFNNVVGNPNSQVIIYYDNATSNIECYQEYANISTSCGGLSTGGYNFTNAFNDGNWITSISSTESLRNLFFNYTKPLDANNNSYMIINSSHTNSFWVETISSSNIVIPDSCWNYGSSIFFMVNTSCVTNSQRVISLYCYNGTWKNIHEKGNCASFSSGAFYEEAMIWNITTTTTNINNKTVGVNTLSASPIINITYPSNNTVFLNDTQPIYSFNYTMIDATSTICKYSLNGGANISITCGNNVTGITLISGWNNITLYVNDSVNNLGVAVNKINWRKTAYSSSNITYQCGEINTAGNYYVNQTINSSICLNITANGVNIIFNNSFGNITYTMSNGQNLSGNISWNGGLNSNIVIGNNTAYVNSTALPTLNISASILLTKSITSYVLPKIMRDKKVCTTCTNLTDLNLQSVSFSVTGFSNYSIGDQPNISIIYPTSNKILTNITNIRFNYTINDSNLDKCWYSLDNAVTNKTLTSCADTYFNLTNYAQDYVLTLFGNDTDGNINSLSINLTAINMTGIETYDLNYLEGQDSIFTINLTGRNSTNITSITPNFIYNNLLDNLNLNTTGLFFNKTFNGLSGGGQKTFYWDFNMTFKGTRQQVTSFDHNQTVVGLVFSLCNSTVNTTFLNISFKDERTYFPINVSLIFTSKYYLNNNNPTTDGVYYKQLLYTNTSFLNSSMYFCFNPAYKNITLKDASWTYVNPDTLPSSINYPSRTYTQEYLNLSNISTDLLLYGLNYNDGRYTQFLITSTAGTALENVDVKLYTSINNQMYKLTDQLTDVSGGTSLIFVNPIVNHILYLNKTGCTPRTINMIPSLASYTYQMDCGTGGVPIINVESGIMDGVQYRTYPPSGIIYEGIINFQLRVSSEREDITRVRLELYDVNGTIIIASQSNVGDAACVSRNCITNITVNTNLYNFTKLKGKYLVDFGSGWMNLETDAYWTKYIISNNTHNLKNVITDLRSIFDNWSTDNSSADAINRAEFSRIIFIFLIMCLLIAAFNKMTGYDSSNPGAFLLLLTGIIWMGSLAGGIPQTVGGVVTGGQGFFYFSNLTPIRFLNNYILAIYMLFITITYILNVNRRAS